MALIECHECKAEISDNAKKCPQCGTGTLFEQKDAEDFVKNMNRGIRNIILYILGFIFFIATVLAFA